MFVGSDPDSRVSLKSEIFEKALACVSDAVVITDEVGAVLYQNSAAEEFHSGLDDISVSMLLDNSIQGPWSLQNPYRSELEPDQTPMGLAKKGYFERDFLVRDYNRHRVFLATYSGRPVQAPEGHTAILIIVIKGIRELKTEKSE